MRGRKTFVLRTMANHWLERRRKAQEAKLFGKWLQLSTAILIAHRSFEELVLTEMKEAPKKTK
jgi:hypothetical protein